MMNSGAMTEVDLADAFRAESADVGTAEQVLGRLRLPGVVTGEPMSTARRWLVPALAAMAVLLLALTTVTVAQLTHKTSPAGPPPGGGPTAAPLSTYHSAGVLFSYPARWFTTAGWAGFGGESVLVYLSSQRLGPSCRRHSNPDGSGDSTCGLTVALARLAADGIAVSWGHGPQAGASTVPFSDAPGVPTTVNERAAKIATGPATDICAAIGAKLQQQVAIAGPGIPDPQGPWTEISACIGPRNQSANEAAFTALLASIRWTS
jgi:hypothetical protein